jgi:replication factor C large subunit
MFSEKYAPVMLSQIIGNDSAVSMLMNFAEKIHKGEKTKPIILVGPSGTGKTSAARALAYGNSFEFLETTASDYRDAETLNRTIIPAGSSRGLFGKTTVILMDEIDELSKKYDTGVERAVDKFLKSTKQPVIFTAEDYWDPSIRFLRGAVEKIEFKKVSQDVIFAFLKKIADREGIGIEKELLEMLAKRSNGDVRGALNDLEALLGASRELIENIGIRDTKMEIFGVLDKIFTSANFDISRNAVMKSSVDTDMLLNWVDENIPVRYSSKASRRDAYYNLARASKFSSKASRTNYWGYLRYSSVLMSSGVAVSNDGYVKLLRQYSFPSKIRHMSSTKEERYAMNEIADKLGEKLHTNKKKIIKDYLPLMKRIFESEIDKLGEEEALEKIKTSYGLETEDIEFIRSS